MKTKRLLYILISFILLLPVVSCQKNDEPVSVTKTYFDGIEFTITLDKGYYELTDTLKTTVSLVNKSGEDIMLYSPTLSPYFTIGFSEDGKLRFGDNFSSAPDAIKSDRLPNNEEYTDTKNYILNARVGSEDRLKTDTEWKITATATIVIDPNGEKRHEDISVEIIVPH